MAVKAVPEGFHTITPQLTIKNCSEAIEFFKKAFGAEEVGRNLDPSGKLVMHADLRIGTSHLFVNDEIQGMTGPARPGSLFLYVDNADKAFERATKAGCKVTMPMGDQFWGDRMGRVTDRWGNEWDIAQHIKDMTPDEIKKAEAAFKASMTK
jgi:uncharacterized glyoxalase superfamily protein PhnB